MRHVLVLSLLLTLGLGFLAADSNASDSGSAGSVAGVVMDGRGQPVAGAKVVIWNGFGYEDTARTDLRGRFSFRGLRPGLYAVQAGKRGVGRDREAAPVRSGQTTLLRLSL